MLFVAQQAFLRDKAWVLNIIAYHYLWSSTCHIINLCLVSFDDKFLIFFTLFTGKTRVGTQDAAIQQDILISGPDTLPEHCFIENSNNAVSLVPLGTCSVDGEEVTRVTKLSQGG